MNFGDMRSEDQLRKLGKLQSTTSKYDEDDVHEKQTPAQFGYSNYQNAELDRLLAAKNDPSQAEIGNSRQTLSKRTKTPQNGAADSESNNLSVSHRSKKGARKVTKATFPGKSSPNKDPLLS